MVKYSVAMGIRMLCILAALFVHGWWLLIPALGAVFLPYIAVVIANNSLFAGGDRVERPGAVVLRDPNLPGSPFPGSASPGTDGPPGFGNDERGAGTP